MEYINQLRIAQSLKRLITTFLLGEHNHPGYLGTELCEAWNKLFTESIFISLEKQQEVFKENIPRFLKAYMCVVQCMEITKETDKIIVHARKDLHQVIGIVNAMVDNSTKLPTDSAYTFCAELEETFGRNTTWLQMLIRGLPKGDWKVDFKDFRRVVEMGAIGITEKGLKYMFSLSPDMTTAQLLREIESKVIKSDVLPLDNHTAVWWRQISQPECWKNPYISPITRPFSGDIDVRIFPRLQDQSLFPNNQIGIKSYQSNNVAAVDDFSIYAVQGVIPGINVVEQIVQLINPLVVEVLPSYHRYTDHGTFDREHYVSTLICTGNRQPKRGYNRDNT